MTLTAVGIDGQTAQASQTVTVSEKRLDIEVSPQEVPMGEQTTVDVTVTDAASGLGIDSAKVKLSDPSGLQVQTDQSGFAAVIVEPTVNSDITVTVSKDGYPNATETIDVVATQPPVASVDISPNQPTVGTSINFDASASSDPDGTIQTYEWDFNGDGLTDRRTSSPTVTHTFQKSGNFTVNLTVVDDNGRTTNVSTVVSVRSDNQNQGPFEGITAQYNDNGDKELSITELGDAASDFATGKITIAELGEVAAAYAKS